MTTLVDRWLRKGMSDGTFEGNIRKPNFKGGSLLIEQTPIPLHRLAAGVMFVETLPKNQPGKLLRRELKAQVFKGSFGY